MTSLPAEFLGLKDRGLLRKDYKADVVIFAPGKVRDTATYDNPKQYSIGIDYAILNGKISIEKGTYNGGLNGSALILTENGSD